MDVATLAGVVLGFALIIGSIMMASTLGLRKRNQACVQFRGLRSKYAKGF